MVAFLSSLIQKRTFRPGSCDTSFCVQLCGKLCVSGAAYLRSEAEGLLETLLEEEGASD